LLWPAIAAPPSVAILSLNVVKLSLISLLFAAVIPLFYLLLTAAVSEPKIANNQ
jgi:hypothetical protein